MSALNLAPKFTDRAGYRKWRDEWRVIYKHLSKTIKDLKQKVRETQKSGGDASGMQSNLHYERVMAFKAMSMLDEAKLRMKRIYEMQKQLKEQSATFPLEIKDCKVLDFHFNKVFLEFSQFPMWVVKTKGQQFFVKHFEADGSVPMETRELPNAPSTKGMLRFRHCILTIDADGNATIRTMPKSNPLVVSLDEPNDDLELNVAA